MTMNYLTNLYINNQTVHSISQAYEAAGDAIGSFAGAIYEEVTAYRCTVLAITVILGSKVISSVKQYWAHQQYKKCDKQEIYTPNAPAIDVNSLDLSRFKKERAGPIYLFNAYNTKTEQWVAAAIKVEQVQNRWRFTAEAIEERQILGSLFASIDRSEQKASSEKHKQCNPQILIGDVKNLHEFLLDEGIPSTKHNGVGSALIKATFQHLEECQSNARLCAANRSWGFYYRQGFRCYEEKVNAQMAKAVERGCNRDTRTNKEFENIYGDRLLTTSDWAQRKWRELLNRNPMPVVDFSQK